MMWRKSTYSSGNGGDCVEIATADPATALVRNSQHPARGTLTMSTAAVAAFVAACQAGELDDLAR